VDSVSGHGDYVTGMVMIDSQAAGRSPGFGAGGLGVVLLHELGHLVGLGCPKLPSRGTSIPF
jgi:hypothetical protein